MRDAKVQLSEQRDRDRQARERREHKALLQEATALERRAAFIADVRRTDKVKVAPRKGRVLSGDKRYATAVAVASDWHVEEDVNPKKVNGLNEYNLTIAEHRAERFFAGAAWLVKEQQALFTIKKMVLCIIGDIITGYIHEELLESNNLSPTQAIVFAKGLLVKGIRSLLAQGLEVHCVCKFGNHGRTTPKTRIGTAAANSFEFLLYQVLAAEFAAEPRVSWQIDEGHHSVTEVNDFRLHTHHGDSVRSQGGIGGILVPLNRARLQWQEKYASHLSVVGHFHQYSPGTKLIVNGSLVGYGAYSDWLPSAAPEPAQQAFFLLDSKRGICQQTPIWCSDLVSAKRAR